MQTFLPVADFDEAARLLDYRRLGKQRVETFQLLNAIRGVDKNGEPKMHKGWVNHPATVMWRRYVPALALYGFAMCKEWKRRGYNDSLMPKFEPLTALSDGVSVQMPYWLGDEEFHRSHRSNLVRKDPVFYIPLFQAEGFDIEHDLPYIWFPEVQEVKIS